VATFFLKTEVDVDARTPHSREAESALTRRQFVAAAGVAGIASLASTSKHARDAASLPPDLENNVYTRLLGVRPHLPAHEHISRLGGGRMGPEVLSAMAEANDFFVDMHELNIAAGKRAAELLGAEAAIITAGGFSGLILAAAACLTGDDEKKREALPQVTWPRCECLIQTAHRFSYDRAYRAAGMTIVEASAREEFMSKLTDRTAMIAGITIAERQSVFAPPFIASHAPPPDAHVMHAEEMIAIGKKAGVPVLIDMASDAPPWNNLQRLIDAGADLLPLSGGKVMGGPQSSGVLLGRKDLIEAARLNATPFENIGRGMKVGKEEVIGLIVAIERYVKLDRKALTDDWERKARRIVDRLQGIPGLTAEVALNTAGFSDAALVWDESRIHLNKDTLRKQLKDGHPRVELEVMITQDKGTSIWRAIARTRVMREGEELMVAGRLREVFLAAQA
jgi:seryl-tRNA(Sec) selenium transferase